MKSSPGENTVRRYAVFLSYRHADNKEAGRQWATWLHQMLEGYEVPADLVGTKNNKGEPIAPSLYPVFRDEEELPADADLTKNIRHALENSSLLVVLCSPRAVESRFVADEIRYFKELGKSDRILALMIDGEPNAANDPGKIKAGIKPELECLPEPLRLGVAGPDGRMDWTQLTEPIAADVRPEGKPEQGWTTGAAYREALHKAGKFSEKEIAEKVHDYERRLELAKLKVVAGALGVPLGVLTKRDKAMQLRKARERARNLKRWLVAVGVLALLVLVAGIFAWHQMGVAQQREAEVSDSFSRSDFMRATELHDQGKSGEALAYLAQALRQNIQNLAAARKAVFLLQQAPLYFPTPIPLPAGQKSTLSLGEDGRARVFAITNRVLSVFNDSATQLYPPLTLDDDVWTISCFKDPDIISIDFGRSGLRYLSLGKRDWVNPPGEVLRREQIVKAALAKIKFPPSRFGDDEVARTILSPAGTRLLVVHRFASAGIYNTKDGKALWEGDFGNANDAFAFSDDDSVFVAGGGIVGEAGEEGLLMIFHLFDGMPPRVVSVDVPEPIMTIKIQADKKTFLTAGYDTADLWQIEGKHLLSFPRPYADYSSEDLQATAGAGRVLWESCYWDRAGLRWERTTTNAPFAYSPATNATAYPGPVRLTDDGGIDAWDADKKQWRPLHLPGRAESFVVHPDGKQMVVGGYYYIQKWDLTKLAPSSDAIRMPKQTVDLRFSKDGSLLVVENFNQEVEESFCRVWDTALFMPLSDPIWGDDVASHEDLTGWALDEQWQLHLQADDNSTITVEVAPSNEPVPAWFIELLEVMGGKYLTRDGLIIELSPNQRHAMLEEVRKAANEDAAHPFYRGIAKRISPKL